MTQSLSIQEYYAPEFSHCWGCGQAHPSGLHLRSYMAPDGASATCTSTPPDMEVDYLRPTPMNCALKVLARPLEVTDRKAVLEMELWAGEVKTATSKMVAVRFVKK